MIRRILVASLLLLLPLPAIADETCWYARAVIQGPTGITNTYFWSKGRSLRALTIIQGRPILTLVHRDWYYVVDELNGKGLAIQRGAQALREDASGERPFGQEAALIVKQGAEKVRTDTVRGQRVDVWRLTDDQARREVWTAENRPDIPLRVQVFDRGTGTERTVQYVDWSWDLQIPDRFFRPDARIELDRMSYDEYLRRTATNPPALPVLYGSLLHGMERVGK